MKRFLICLSLLFSVSTFAAQEGRFVQKDNIFPRVEIVTSLGSIVVELDRSKAPITVNNFLTYVMDKSYQGSIFHRVERDVENDRGPNLLWMCYIRKIMWSNSGSKLGREKAKRDGDKSKYVQV